MAVVRGGRSRETPVPVLLQQIVDDRLARLGDETAALLAIAAVVGQEVPLAVWEAVTRADEETLAGRGRAGGGGASGDGMADGRRHPLHPRADPRRAVRGCARAAAAAAAPAGGARCLSRSPRRTRTRWRTTSSGRGTSARPRGWCGRASGPRMPTRW